MPCPATSPQKHAIRRYGFHGTSHHFVSQASAELLGRPVEELNQVVLHLGNGCSASAIRGGVAVETSMGLTPLRAWSWARAPATSTPACTPSSRARSACSIDEIDDLLNKRSGLLGLSGVNDFRELSSGSTRATRRPRLAFDVFVHRLKHYVGAYLAQLGRLDILVFTAGIGQNSPRVRAALADGLDGLGIAVDPDATRPAGEASPSRPSSRRTPAG